MAKNNSLEARKKIIELKKKENLSTLLDIGAGKLLSHTKAFQAEGFEVDTVDFFEGSTFKGNYMTMIVPGQYDVVWSSHCLEHQLNVNSFLRKIHTNTKEGGYVALTVPPLKHQIVGGHVSLWNAGLVLYNLILAGFDCSNASVKTYGYNISVIVKKKTIRLPELKFGGGDIETLSEYFPFQAKQGFNGQIESLNW